MKKFETLANEINIYTEGLDNIILENSDSDFIQVFLYAESYDDQVILIDNKKNGVDVKFHFEGTETREVIFRKFVTKRLQRATVTIKIPISKKVYVFGETVDVEAKSLKNDLAIYIENGIVKLGSINSNTNLKLYSGNVFACVKDVNIDVISNDGKIKINKNIFKKKFKKLGINTNKKITINTIKANIFLTSK
ncbi:MAG: hypothetical protein ABJH82_12195 [Polaribacter sp.]|uniref:hypothetical protein n=1 Tax=Polaribacter sp. TaxID=1920175 RepID=UPI003263F25D